MVFGFFEWLFQTYPNAAPLMFLVVGVSFLCAGIAALMPPPGKGPSFTNSHAYALLYRVINFIAINLKWARNYGDPKIEKYDPVKGTPGGVMDKLAALHVVSHVTQISTDDTTSSDPTSPHSTPPK